MKNKVKYFGYVPWNDAGYDNNFTYPKIREKYAGKFPEGVLLASTGIKTIHFYQESALIKTKYPENGMLVTTKDVLKIPVKDIVRISRWNGPLDNADGMNIHKLTEKQIKLFNKPPFADCSEEDGAVSVGHWYSYNKKVGKKEIECFCNEQKCKGLDQHVLKQMPDIVRIVYAWD